MSNRAKTLIEQAREAQTTGLALAGVHLFNARICSCAEQAELEPAAQG